MSHIDDTSSPTMQRSSGKLWHGPWIKYSNALTYRSLAINYCSGETLEKPAKIQGVTVSSPSHCQISVVAKACPSGRRSMLRLEASMYVTTVVVFNRLARWACAWFISLLVQAVGAPAEEDKEDEVLRQQIQHMAFEIKRLSTEYFLVDRNSRTLTEAADTAMIKI